MYDSDVVIIGAGPTGLTLALELARRSIAFRLIDQAEAPFAGSRGKGIQPRTLEILEDLGVIGPILKAGIPYPRIRLHLGPLSLQIGSLGSNKTRTEGVPYPNLWLVPQNCTESILRDRLVALGGQVEYGLAFKNAVQDEHGVQVHLSSGEFVRTQYVVGCDGGHSAVRKALGLSLHGETLDRKSVFVADVEVEGLDRTDWHVWPFAKGGSIGLCPLPNSSLFQLTLPREPAEGVEAIVQRVTKHEVRRIAWSSTYRPAVRMVDRYRIDRIFLAGDAAHVHPPAGGQGLNTGIQDAYNLGWKLAEVVNQTSPESLLDTYHAERHPIGARAIEYTRERVTSGAPDEPSKELAGMLSGLGIHYDLGGDHPLIGRRMPDLDLRTPDGPTRVYNLLHDARWVQLDFRRDVTYDGVWELPVIGEVEPPSAVSIRPDGYVASIER